jgi:dihydrofolate reductase
VPRPMRSLWPGPTERRPNQRKGNCDDEADDYHVRLRRRSDAGSRRAGRGPSGGFERGGWIVPHFDTETATFVNQVYRRADAFLFGRPTYEIFAGAWGAMADPGDNPIWVALNTMPKYVASTTLTDPRWANTTVLSSEVAAAVGELRAKPGCELQVHGSRTLIRWLLDNNLVDELNLLIFPVVVGQGTRLFPDTGQGRALELVESRATPSGGDDPGLPAHRAPAIRNGHGRYETRDIGRRQTGDLECRDR